MTAEASRSGESARVIYRHPWVIRLTHWINVVAMTILLMSGLQIFNAHPALYLGKASDFEHPLFQIGATGDNPDRGFVQAFGAKVGTTGVLGVSKVDGEETERGFPAWVTLPAVQDLATGRRWHFLFAWIFLANGLLYVGYVVLSGQWRRRLVPDGRDLAHIGTSLREHLTLHFPKGAEAARYNVIQKITYFIVVLGLLPLQILAGLAMSPGMDAFAPWLLDLFGGRQSARTIHFVTASLLLLFVVVHVVMVVATGPINNMRGMITGWFALWRNRAKEAV